MREVLIVAGESSGESYGAELVRELKREDHDFKFFGIAGDEMKKEGVESLFGIEKISIIGIVEVIPHVFRLIKIMKRLVEEAEKRKVECAILIDSPDFNLRLARKLRKINVPVIYLISPTVWAWRRGRIKKIKKYVSLLLIIFPFEREIYEKAGVPHIFVGHPLKDRIRDIQKDGKIKEKLGISDNLYVISLLPGSRISEVRNHLPVLIDSIKELKGKVNFKAFLIKAPGVSLSSIKEFTENTDIEIVEENRYEVMACSDLALASCGTSNLELMLLGVPFIAFYRLSTFTYLIAKSLAKVKNASIVNILAGRELVPELLQKKFKTGNIVENTLLLLSSVEKRDFIKNEFKRIKESLGENGAISKSAEAIINFLREK